MVRARGGWFVGGGEREEGGGCNVRVGRWHERRSSTKQQKER